MAGWIFPSEYAILVTVNVALAHCQVGPQLQDGRAIFIRPSCVDEFDVLYRRIVSRDYPNRSAAKALARGINPRTPIHADDCQVVRGPAADITVVVAGSVDLDCISRGSRIYGATGRQVLRSEERRVGKECRSRW